MINDIFVQQHRDIMRIAGKIEDQFSTGNIVNPYTIRSLLSVLIGKLKVHLDMEHDFFAGLPESLNKEHSGPHRSQNVLTFREDVRNFSKKWSAPSSIGEEPQNFIDDTRVIFAKLDGLIDLQEQRM